MALEQITRFWEPLIEATVQHPFYLQYGLLVVFIYALTPNALFIPNEAFWIPLFFEAEDPQKFLVMIVFLTAIAGFIGDTLVFLGARHGMRFFIKGFRQKEQLKMSSLFHRYHRILFIISPSIPFLSEGVLIFAAFKKLSFEKFSPFLLLGNFVKNILEVIIFIGIGMGVGFM